MAAEPLQSPLPFHGSLDRDGLLVLVEREAAGLLAHPHPDDAPLVREARREALGGAALEVEYRVLDVDGRERWVVERLEPGPAGVAVDGEVSGPDELAAAELAGLVASVDEALYIVDILPGGTIEARWLGPGWARVLGAAIPDAGWALDAWVSAVHPDDVPGFLRRIADLLEGRQAVATYRVAGLDGVERWVRDRAVPRPLAGGGVRAEGIVVDVTEERRLAAGLADAQARLAAVLAGVDDLVYTVQLVPDGSLHVVVASPAAARVVGADGSDAVCDLWGDAVHPLDRHLRDRLAASARAGIDDDAELRVRGRDGAERWVWHRVRPRTDAVGRLLVDGVASDVSRRRADEEALDGMRRQLDAVLAVIDEVLLSVRILPDGEVRQVFAGPGLDRLLGVRLPSRPPPAEVWWSQASTTDPAAFAQAVDDARAGRPVRAEYLDVGPGGRRRYVGWRGTARAVAADGSVVVDGILADVTERRVRTDALAKQLDEAEHASRVDGLTGIWNRRHVREELERALVDRRRAAAVLLLDVDRFKSVNDTYGHHVGDEVLIELARRLAASVRVADVVGRWGGEEFCVVLERVRDDAALLHVAEGLRRVIGGVPFATAAGPLPVTASFGAARPLPDDGVDELVAAADRALYAAKEGGRNRVVLAERPGG